jgi:hypothetical protein
LAALRAPKGGAEEEEPERDLDSDEELAQVWMGVDSVGCGGEVWELRLRLHRDCV